MNLLASTCNKMKIFQVYNHAIIYQCIVFSAAAQQEYVRNFQLVNKTGTHFTLSWDIVDGNYSENDISFFYLYYNHGAFSYSRYIWYHSTYQINSTNAVRFFYTISTQSFTYEEYIMYIEVYRRRLRPAYTYSNRRFVDVGMLL